MRRNRTARALAAAAGLLAGLGLLSGCGQRSSGADVVAAPEAVRDASAPAQAVGKEAPGDAPAGAMLAYSYEMGVLAPKSAIEPMLAAHQRVCAEAGPRRCQVLSASMNAWSDEHVAAALSLRAEPGWLAEFRAAIARDAERAGGRLTSNTARAEDLTQYIVDLDARLSAKLALRDRIRTLLETSSGSLSDVLAAERALAEVQGEIDSMTAMLAQARARVDMSILSISYRSDPATSVSLFKPLERAFAEFGRTSIRSLAEAVEFVAQAWPFFILLLIAVAILRAWLRRRPSRSAAPKKG